MCNIVRNKTKIVASNPLKADPTRTTQLRLRFEQLLRGKFAKLKQQIFKLIVEDDAFGIKRKISVIKNEEQEDDEELLVRREGQNNSLLDMGQQSLVGTNTFSELVTNQPGRWQFQTTSKQVESFENWIQTQIDEGILDGKTGKTKSEGYWRAFSDDGYSRGAGRAFNDVRMPALSSGRNVSDFFEGTRDEFLRQSFSRPVSIDKLKLLAGRVFTDLQGITTAMSTQLSRQLVDGLARGAGPATIAAEMLSADGPLQQIGARRATLLARTEIIRAHAEGQLDAFENLGVTEIGVMAEWSTARDDRVCPLCEALEGSVMSVKEARGLIPRHAQCRCAFLPANVGESTKKQVRGQKSVQKAIDDSIRAELPKGRIIKGGARRFQNPVTGQGPFTFVTKRTLAQQKTRSRWLGADRTISKRRPKAVVKPLGKPSVTKPKPKRVLKQEDVASFSAKLKGLKSGTQSTIPPTNLLGEPGFSRLIVGTEIRRDGLAVTQRIVVFDAEATVTGQGAFKKSIAKLKKQGLPIRMDNVQTEQFRKGLERLGFKRSGDSMVWSPKT